MHLGTNLPVLPLQIYKFCFTPTAFYLSCAQFLVTQTPFSFISWLFLNPITRSSITATLQLYFISTRTSHLWHFMPYVTRRKLRNSIINFRTANRSTLHRRNLPQFKTRLLASTFFINKPTTSFRRPGGFKQLALHPYFSYFYPAGLSSVRKFPLLDPVRRYKDFDVLDRENFFLRTDAPLRMNRSSTPLKPVGLRKKSLLLQTLLKKVQRVKIYTLINSLSVPKISKLVTKPRNLFLGQPSLKLLRRERRLYIRMLPQMRLSPGTLKLLHESDVRYWLIKDCYFKYRSQVNDRIKAHAWCFDTIPASELPTADRRSTHQLFYYNRTNILTNTKLVSTNPSLTPSRFTSYLRKDSCNQARVITGDLLGDFVTARELTSTDLISLQTIQQLQELYGFKVNRRRFAQLRTLRDRKVTSGLRVPLTYYHKAADSLLTSRILSRQQVKRDFSVINKTVRQRQEALKRRRVKKLRAVKLSKRLNLRSDWFYRVWIMSITSSRWPFDKQLSFSRRFRLLVRYRLNTSNKLRTNRLKTLFTLKSHRVQSSTTRVKPYFTNLLPRHWLKNTLTISAPRSTEFVGQVPSYRTGTTTFMSKHSYLCTLLPRIVKVLGVRDTRNLFFKLAISTFSRLRFHRYWWDRRAKRRQRRKLMLRYLSVRGIYSRQVLKGLYTLLSYSDQFLTSLSLLKPIHLANPSYTKGLSLLSLHNVTETPGLLNPMCALGSGKSLMAGLDNMFHCGIAVTDAFSVYLLPANDVYSKLSLPLQYLPSTPQPVSLRVKSLIQRPSFSYVSTKLDTLHSVVLGATFYEVQIKTQHTNPFILPAYGYMYLFNVDKGLTNTSIWHARLNKMLYSFADLLDVKRYILRRFTKTSVTPSVMDSQIETFLSSQKVPFLSNSLKTGVATNSTLGGAHWINPTYDRQESHILDIPGRSDPNTLINYTMRIKRIRFKPGYSRIWRQARSSFKSLAGLNFRYQQKLTTYLLRLIRVKQNFSFKAENLRLSKILERVHFANDFLSSETLIEWHSVYLNGYVVENSQLVLCVNDFIQMIVHLKYYITYRWLGHWALKKRNRIFKLKKLKWKPTSFRLDKQRSYSLPNWLLGYQTINFDLPKYLEVDYLTLSIFVIYEPFMYADLYLSPEMLPKTQVSNMYNWKYIT